MRKRWPWARKAAEGTDKQMMLLDSPLLPAYLNHLGQKVAQASRRPQIHYTFKIVDTDSVNAFSLPGGFIYVNRGLLDFVMSESELAGVVAHEVGHIVAYHSMNDVARRYWIDQGMYQLKKAGMLDNQQMVDMLQKYGGPMLLFARPQIQPRGGIRGGHAGHVQCHSRRVRSAGIGFRPRPPEQIYRQPDAGRRPFDEPPASRGTGDGASSRTSAESAPERTGERQHGVPGSKGAIESPAAAATTEEAALTAARGN